MKQLTLLFLLPLFFLLGFFSTAVAQVNADDYRALVALYNATGGDNWTTKYNWDVTQDPNTNTVDNSWYGITIENQRVVDIRLGSNNLQNSIPSDFSSLSKLRALFISDNQLRELPANFGNLTQLTVLDLSSNQLTELPVSISNLINLTSLIIQVNQLTELPTNFENQNRLISLDLSGNQLTELPINFGNLSSLRSLALNNNQLTELPISFGSLISLEYLNIGLNQLTELPVSFGSLISLEYLNISLNQLTELPINFENLSSLRSLALNNNQLTELPINFGNLSSIRSLSLTNNQLTELPINFGNLSLLISLDLNNNQLTELPINFGNIGSYIDPFFGQSISLESLLLRDNLLQFQALEQIKDITIKSVSLTNNITFGEWTSISYSPQNKYSTQNVQGILGQSIQLDGTVTGTASANTYRWYKSGSTIEIPNPNTNKAILTIDNTTAADEGTYYCKVTNSIVTGLELISEDIEVTLTERNSCDELVSDWTLNTATYDPTSGELIGTGQASSSESSSLAPNEDGYLEIDLSEIRPDGDYFIGFSDVQSGSWIQLDYSYKITNDVLRIYRNNFVGAVMNVTLTQGDKLRLERKGDRMIFSLHRNGETVILRNVFVEPSDRLYVGADVRGGRSNPAYLNTCLSGLEVVVDNSDCSLSNGGSILLSSSESGNYSYQVLIPANVVPNGNFIGDGSITTLNNLSSGWYTIRISDGNTSRDFVRYVNPNAVIFDGVGTASYSYVDNQLTSTGGASSSTSHLASNEDGYLEIDLSDLRADANYFIGFSDVQTNTYAQFDYSYKITNDVLRIYHGVVGLATNVTLQSGDKLRLERRYDRMIFSLLRNSQPIILRNVFVEPSDILYVGADVYAGRSNPAYLNKCILDPCAPIALSEDWSYSTGDDIHINANGQLEFSTLSDRYASALWNEELLPESENGKLSFTVGTPITKYYFIGLTSEIALPASQMNSFEAAAFMDHGWFINANKCEVYESGTSVFDKTLVTGDQFSVERRGNKIQYRINDLLVWESDVDETIPLRSCSSIWAYSNQTITIPVINFSPCPTYDVITTYDVTTDLCSATQSIELSTLPTGSYTYEWTSLETGSTNSGNITGNSVSLPEGRYRITTSLGSIIVDETIVNLHLGNSLNWSTNEFIEYDFVNSQLVGTSSNLGYAWSLSDEEITASTPRKLSMIVSSGSDTYMLGLTGSVGLPTDIRSSMDYGWYVHSGDGLAIYENGRQYTFPYEEGVKLSIERIGNQILYRKDDLLVYQSSIDNPVTLYPHSIVWQTDRVPTIEYSCISELDAPIATIETGSNSCTGTEVSIFPLLNSDDYTYEYTYLDVVSNLVTIPTGNPAVFIPPFDGKYNVKVTNNFNNQVQEFVIDINTKMNWAAPTAGVSTGSVWALGTESLQPDQNGSVSFTINRCVSGYYQVGLSSTDFNSNSMKYGWYVFLDELRIYELGQHVMTVPSTDYPTCTIGTNLSVEKINNAIYYYINGVLFHTTDIVDVTANLYPYYIHWYDYELPPISFTSCEITTCDASPLLSISERVGYDYEWYDALDRTISLGTGTEYTSAPLPNGMHVFTIVGTNTNDGSQYVITQTVNIEADIELLALTASPTATLGEQFYIEGILGVNRDLSGYDIEWIVDGYSVFANGVFTNSNQTDYGISLDFLTLEVLNFTENHTYLLKLTPPDGSCEIMLEKTVTLRVNECISATPIPVFGLDLSKNYSFLELNSKLSASYYSTNEEGLLNFKYTERYKEGDLDIHIYNWERCEIGKVELTKKIGTNWYSLDLNEVCTESEYYVMEVFDENNKRTVLNFKHGLGELRAKLVGDGWYCPNETLNYKVAIENGHADYIVELWGKRNGSTEWILLDVQSTDNNDLTGSVANTSVNFPIEFIDMEGNAMLKALVIDDWGNEVETDTVGIEERPECSENERIAPPVASEKKGYKINVRFSIRNLLPKIHNIFKTR